MDSAPITKKTILRHLEHPVSISCKESCKNWKKTEYWSYLFSSAIWFSFHYILEWRSKLKLFFKDFGSIWSESSQISSKLLQNNTSRSSELVKTKVLDKLFILWRARDFLHRSTLWYVDWNSKQCQILSQPCDVTVPFSPFPWQSSKPPKIDAKWQYLKTKTTYTIRKLSKNYIEDF